MLRVEKKEYVSTAALSRKIRRLLMHFTGNPYDFTSLELRDKDGKKIEYNAPITLMPVIFDTELYASPTPENMVRYYESGSLEERINESVEGIKQDFQRRFDQPNEKKHMHVQPIR